MITTVSLVTICHYTYILQYYLLYSIQCTSQVVLVVKSLPTNSGGVTDTVFIPGSGRSPGEGIGQPTPVFLPGESHPMDRGAWGATVLRVAESDMTEVT